MSVVPDQTIWNMAGQSPVYRSYWESCLPPLAVAGRGWVLEAQSSIHSCSLFSEASMQWSVAGHPGLADVGHRLSLMPVESLRAKRVRGPQVWGAEYAGSLLCCLPWCPGRARQPSLGNVSGDFTVSVERSILLQLGSSVSFHCQASWEHLR